MILALLSLGSGAIAEPAVIAEYEGKASINTTPFTVEGPFLVQWTVEGDRGRFTVGLMDMNAKNVDLVVRSKAVPHGSWFYPKAGTYYFSVVVSGGAWSLKVVPYEE